MFTSSVRRAASHALPTPILSSFSSSAPRLATSQALSYRSHQRRLSSSKPSRPADGSGNPQAEESSIVGEGRAKRKTKESSAKGPVRDAALAHLPSVPTTHHVKDKDIAASSFFSLHRPISIISSFPKTTSDDAFAAIFTPRTQNVISTLSRTVDYLDTNSQLQAASLRDNFALEVKAANGAIAAVNVPEGSNINDVIADLENASADSIPFPSHINTQYPPFTPPPAPVPMNTADSLAAGAEAAEASQTSHRIYKTTITIEESTSADGQVTYFAHTSDVVAEDPPTVPARFLERMIDRQEKYNEYREKRFGETEMLAISVKRQRKLKMKKHKYKKLMKRTRNLRRRIERST